MTQSVFDFSNFSWIALLLKRAAQALEPSIAFHLPCLILRFFGEQAINGFLQGNLTFSKLRQNVGDELFHLSIKLRQSSVFATQSPNRFQPQARALDFRLSPR